MQVQRQSDPILQLLDSSLAVEDSVTVHGGPIIAPTLDQRLSPHSTVLVKEGETEDGESVYRVVLYNLRDELAASREGLSSIELEHIDLQQQITKLVIEREGLLHELQRDYTYVRGVLDKRLGGREADATAGVQGPTAQKGTKLVRQVKVAVHKLSKPDLELPEEAVEFGFDPQQTAVKLQAKADRFEELLERLRLLRREAELTLLAKNQTAEEHKATFQAITGTLVGFYRLAGRDDLADRIRASTVQRGRRAVDVEVSGASEPAVDGQSSGVPSSEASSPAGDSAPNEVPASPSPEDAAGELTPAPSAGEGSPDA